MIYLEQFILPDELTEIKFIESEKRTCFHTFYPFKIFPEKELKTVELDRITLLYGGNGSGQSTLINVMAEKMNAVRFSEFNSSPLFDQFVRLCRADCPNAPESSIVLTSDDVFDYALNARSVNGRIDDHRNALFEKYVETHREAVQNPNLMRFRGLDDFERWKETKEILSPKRTQSNYIRKRVASDVALCSNGETALRYFIDRIDGDALYFLDEPENSLSIELQLRLAEYIEATARATRSQFVIATHSPILLAMQDARIYNLDGNPARICPWTSLPNVRAYFDFFAAHRHEFEKNNSF